MRDLEANEYLSICGYLFNGKSISLLSCSKPRQQLSIPGMCLFEYSPSIVIIGNEFSSIEDISLNSITIHFIGLEEWLAHGIFSIAKDPQNNNFNMNYSMPSSCEADMGEYYIKFDYNFNIHCDKFKELSAVHKAGVKFEFKETSSWKQAMDAVCNFKTFVTLCLGTEIQIDSISAKDGDNQKFDVFYNTNINSNIKLKNWFFIYFNDIKDNFNECMNVWNDKIKIISPVVNYFVEAHNEPTSIVSGFLRMVQALESYSRRCRKCTLIPPEEHEKRISEILESIEDANNQEWLRKVLSTPIINEPSCQQRITTLFKEISGILNVSNSKIKTLSYRIVTSRNYYTHFNESLKENILSDTDLYYSTVLMRYVLRILIMRELSFNDEYISENILKDSEIHIAMGELGITNKFIACKVSTSIE